MAKKTGKYSDLCEELHAKAEADGTVIMVHNGLFGSGFSAHGSTEFCMALPATLRQVADQIECQNRTITHRLS